MIDKILYYIILYYIICCFGFLSAGCNKRDLNVLGDIADDHQERLAKLEWMIIEAERQIDAINKLLNEYDRRIIVTGTKATANGGYKIFFSDQDSVEIKSAETPVVEWSADRTWVINGTDTGIKAVGDDAEADAVAPQIREQGGMWEISTDGGTNWQPTGVKVKGETGEDAVAPQIGIGENGNWLIDGKDTGKKAVGSDGISAVAPQVSVRENSDGSFNWWIKNGDQDWEDTGVCAIGRDGKPGEDGKPAPYIKQVTVSGTQVIFTFSENIPGQDPPTNVMKIVRESIYSFLYGYPTADGTTGEWTREPIPVGEFTSTTLRYRFRMPAGSKLLRYHTVGSEHFGVSEIRFYTLDDVVTGKVVLQARSSLRKFYSELLKIVLTDSRGVETTCLIPVETKVICADVRELDFADSDVYYLQNNKGRKMVEVCKEYLNNGTISGIRATVVYPYDASTLTYDKGCVTSYGGTVNHRTGTYDESGDYALGQSVVYVTDCGARLPENGTYLRAIQVKPERWIPDVVQDVDENHYPVVKIGSQYWMKENLKTGRYNTGEKIAYLPDKGQWTTTLDGAYCFYGNEVVNKEKWGVLYNWQAVATGLLAPAGWHVPDDEEWLVLEKYLGMKEIHWELMGTFRGTQGDKMKQEGYWGDVIQGGRSGFEAIPAGRRSGGEYMDLSARAVWWSGRFDAASLCCREIAVDQQGIKRALASENDGYSVRCVRDVR